MRSHELAKLLLAYPDSEITASIDLDSKVQDENGDTLISKVFGYSLIEAIQDNRYTTLLFEEAGSGGANIDVVDAVIAAQTKVAAEIFNALKGKLDSHANNKSTPKQSKTS